MSQRAERVAELIKQEISKLLQKGLKDPRIGFVTVTGVEVTKDLRNSKVYVSVFGDEQAKRDSMAGLNAANGFIRRELGKHLHLSHTPEIIFKFDKSVEYGAHINQLLHRIKSDQSSVGDGGKDEHFKGDS